MPKTISKGSRALTVSSTARAVVRPQPTLEDYRAFELEEPDDALAFEKVVGIDPGLQGTGVAIFVEGDLLKADVLMAQRIRKNAPWPARADNIAHQLTRMMGSRSRDVLVCCEMPEFQGGAARTMGWK